MKPLIAIFISLHFLTASATVYNNSEPYHASIHQINAKQKNQFVFKIGKLWKGANVEVINENGELVSQQKLYKKRMTIDFNNVKTGNYTIFVRKGDKVEQFKYFR